MTDLTDEAQAQLMTLLDEKAALYEIRSLLAGARTAKLAVAFWGMGAIDRVGLDRDGLALEILCNLDSGACNPVELRKLLNRPGIMLKSHPALHAKVWWTPNGAVIGSSNASANGLALENDLATGWHEANLRLDGSEALDDVRHWFNRLFAAGYEIGPSDLDRAELLWKARAKIAPQGRRLPTSLFGAFRSTPEHAVWRKVKLAFCRDDLGRKAQSWLTVEKEGGRLAGDVSAYDGWNDRIAPGDWVIDYWMASGGSEFTGLWQALPAGTHPPALRLVRKVKRVTLLPLGRFGLAGDEREALGGLGLKAVERYSDDGRNAVIGFADAMAMLAVAGTAAGPDPRAFDRAMLAIYEEAMSFGYRPIRFREMLADLGGIETARRLIRGSATSGFEKLWRKGRLDLSVEALILKAEWRPLFTDEEADLARRRLRQFRYWVDE